MQTMFFKAEQVKTDSTSPVTKKTIFLGDPGDLLSPPITIEESALPFVNIPSDYQPQVTTRQFLEKQGLAVVKSSAVGSKPMGGAGNGLCALEFIPKGYAVGVHGGDVWAIEGSPESDYKLMMSDKLCIIGTEDPSAADLVQHALSPRFSSKELGTVYCFAEAANDLTFANTKIESIKTEFGFDIEVIVTTEDIWPGQVIARDYGLLRMERIRAEKGYVTFWDKYGKEISFLLFISNDRDVIELRSDFEKFLKQHMHKELPFLLCKLSVTHYSILNFVSPEAVEQLKTFLATIDIDKESFFFRNSARIADCIANLINYFEKVGLQYCQKFKEYLIEMNYWDILNPENFNINFPFRIFLNSDDKFLISHPDTALNRLLSPEPILRANNIAKYYLAPLGTKMEDAIALTAKGKELNTQGLEFYRAKKYDEAIDCWQQALKISKDICFHKGNYIFSERVPVEIYASVDVASLCWNLGNAYSAKKDYQEAVYFFNAIGPILGKLEEEKNNLDPNELKKLSELSFPPKVPERLKMCYQELINTTAANIQTIAEATSLPSRTM